MVENDWMGRKIDCLLGVFVCWDLVDSVMTVIFDLDGTLALADHRRHLVEKPKDIGDNPWTPDWDKFYAECVNDLPNVPVIEMLKTLRSSGYRILIYSGRSIDVLRQTEEWINTYIGSHDGGSLIATIRMRERKDYTPDDILKQSWLDADFSDKKEILCVFDDRDKVVAMWRKNGLTCFQVAPGNF